MQHVQTAWPAQNQTGPTQRKSAWGAKGRGVTNTKPGMEEKERAGGEAITAMIVNGSTTKGGGGGAVGPCNFQLTWNLNRKLQVQHTHHLTPAVTVATTTLTTPHQLPCPKPIMPSASRLIHACPNCACRGKALGLSSGLRFVVWVNCFHHRHVTKKCPQTIYSSRPRPTPPSRR